MFFNFEDIGYQLKIDSKLNCIILPNHFIASKMRLNNDDPVFVVIVSFWKLGKIEN